MNKLDFSDLNRFLVSVGLIFYGLSIGIPWLFLKEGLPCEKSLKEFNDLTDSSKSLVTQKQNYIAHIVDVIPFLSGILLLLGVVQLFLG